MEEQATEEREKVEARDRVALALAKARNVANKVRPAIPDDTDINTPPHLR